MTLSKYVTPGSVKALEGRVRALHFVLDTDGVHLSVEVEHNHRYPIGVFEDMDEADAAAYVLLCEPEIRYN